MSTIEGLTLAPAQYQPKPKPVIDVLLITIPQAATLLSLSERTVHTMISTGKLPSVHFGGSHRIDIEDVRKIARTGCDLPTLAERAEQPKRSVGRPRKQ